MSLLMRALALGLFALGCNGIKSEPCLRWVHPGESYNIKLGTPERYRSTHGY